MSRKAKKPHPPSNLDIAGQVLRAHPAFRRLMREPTAAGPNTLQLSSTDFAVVSASGLLYVNTERRLEPAEWQWVLAHALLHLGLGHAHCATERQPPLPDAVTVAVACVEVNRFLEGLDIGRPPMLLPEMPRDDRGVLERRWRRDGVPDEFRGIGTTAVGSDFRHTQCTHHHGHHPGWEHVFAAGLADAVTHAVDVAGGADAESGLRRQVWDRALSWFVSSYPLLGASRRACGSWPTALWRAARRSASPQSIRGWGDLHQPARCTRRGRMAVRAGSRDAARRAAAHRPHRPP